MHQGTHEYSGLTSPSGFPGRKGHGLEGLGHTDLHPWHGLRYASHESRPILKWQQGSLHVWFHGCRDVIEVERHDHPGFHHLQQPVGVRGNFLPSRNTEEQDVAPVPLHRRFDEIGALTKTYIRLGDLNSDSPGLRKKNQLRCGVVLLYQNTQKVIE